MTTVPSTPTTNSSSSAATTTGSNSVLCGTGKNSIAGDFNSFLTLLTTQLKYQDPMNPQDGQEMAAQLAQFSSVEQLQNANDTLAKIRELLAGSATPATTPTNGTTGTGGSTGTGGTDATKPAA